MPGMKVSVPHQLETDEAVKRIRGLVQQVKTKFAEKVDNVEEEWDGPSGDFSFTVMGMDVSGRIVVDAETVQIEGKIPFAVLPFKGKIESVIQEKAQELLS